MGIEIEEAGRSKGADYQAADWTNELESMKDFGSLAQKLASDGASKAAAVLPELSLITGGEVASATAFAGKEGSNAQSADDLGDKIEPPAKEESLKPGDSDSIEMKPDKTDTSPVDVF